MGRQLEQHLEQRLTQRLTPLQVRYVRLLEMNRQEAEEAAEKELAVNEALETVDTSDDDTAASMFAAANGDIPFYRLHTHAQRSDTDYPSAKELALMNASESMSLYDYLRRQLDERNLEPQVYLAADYIIGNLDTNGYLRRSISGMVDDMAFSSGELVTQEEMEEALKIVRTLDPAGVGASGLRDTLELQLKALPPGEVRDNALQIIDKCFEALTMRHSHRIISTLKLSKEAYSEAIQLIQSLNPRPGSSFGSGDSDRVTTVVPDFIVEEDGSGELHIGIPSRIPELAISESFRVAVQEMERNASRKIDNGKTGGDAAAYVIKSFRDARDFIEIWKQRHTTLLSVITAIVKLQKRYFLSSDDSDLRPMALKDIAELTGYDLSTISRATAGKYVSTSWGIVPLRHLFSERMGSASEDAQSSSGGSARSIQAALKKLVENEDKLHPLSDEELTLRLNEDGHEVKRRTVAKYRELLNIPPSRLRKSL